MAAICCRAVTRSDPSAPRSDWRRIAARAAFVCVPLLSFGYLTGPTLAFAAYRLRSWLLGVAAAGYLAITVFVCGLPDEPSESTLDVMWLLGFGVNMVLGTAHAAFVQHRLFRGNDDRPSTATDPAVAAALARRQRRREARQLLERDPGLAAELRIGRPDLPRQYDDGGLIDVNCVPAHVLSQLPGLGPHHVDRILAARRTTLGLTTVEDLIVYADVPPDVAESLREVLVFRSGTAPD